MSKLELWKRKIKRRWFGATYCTIENRSTHSFKVVGRMDFMLICECSRCGLRATYDRYTGLCA